MSELFDGVLKNLSAYSGAVSLIAALGAALAYAIAYVYTKVYRTKYEKRKDLQKQFNVTVLNLSQSNETSKLAAAVMLRRFFSAKVDTEKFREETIRVISSLLKILPRGIYQKTLGDGLAFAENLNYADLQRTNLQDLYLGVKNKSKGANEKKAAEDRRLQILQGVTELTDNIQDDSNDFLCSCDDNWKITMDFTDMFESDLSEALLENIKGYGTIFYGAIMNNTVIKNCEFTEANFINVDLLNVKFKNVILTGSNFSGAKNLPDDLKEYLDNDNIFIDKDDSNRKGFTSKKLPNQNSRKIFFSIPRSLSKSDEYLTLHYKKLMIDLGYTPIYYTNSPYPQIGQISKIRKEINTSAGVIAFGLKQIAITSGKLRPESNNEEDVSNFFLPTPWNDIEVGMAMMIDLPVLMVKDDNINVGVFDQVIKEKKMKTISTSIDLNDIPNNSAFIEWREMLE